MVKVKLCGLKRPCDIEWANDVRPDYVGFVFAGKKRRVTDDQAKSLRGQLCNDIPVVGVFVDENQAHITRLVRDEIIQVVQLHGQEDDEYIKTLRNEIAVPIIKAFSVANREDVQRACQSRADYILLDNGKGGTGTSFDWSIIQDIVRPFFLAGGLTPENVVEALQLQPYALDVSSGIETDGVKDKAKIQQFMTRIRAALQEEIR